MGGMGRQRQTQKPQARNQALPVTLEELYNGCTKVVTVVKTCHVQGPLGLMQQERKQNVNVEVKRGWKIGTKATVKGGESESDVVLHVKAKPHSQYKVEGN